MSRHEDTLLLPPNTEITEIASGTKVSWPGTDAQGDFRGRPDDGSTPPSYLDSGWLSKINRVLGRVFNARGRGKLSENTKIAELASSVSPYWMLGGVYIAGSQVLHSGVLYTATSAHTATAANAPGQTGAPWVRSDARTTAIEATNIGKTGNQPIPKFTKDDWKDRPIGWHGMIGPGSAGSPDTVNWFYLEKIGNRNTANGHYWQAYPIGSNSYFYVGYNDNPSTQNGGLPYWEKYESVNKTVYSGNIAPVDSVNGQKSTNTHGPIREICRVVLPGRYFITIHIRIFITLWPSGGEFLQWYTRCPYRADGNGAQFVFDRGVSVGNKDASLTNIADCRMGANEAIRGQIIYDIQGNFKIQTFLKCTAIRIGD